MVLGSRPKDKQAVAETLLGQNNTSLTEVTAMLLVSIVVSQRGSTMALGVFLVMWPCHTSNVCGDDDLCGRTSLGPLMEALIGNEAGKRVAKITRGR